MKSDLGSVRLEKAGGPRSNPIAWKAFRARLIGALVATFIFIILLITVYVAHARLGTVDVVFYSALGDVVVATLISACFLCLDRRFNIFGAFEKALMVLVWALTGYAFAISVPTVIDRSLSFYLLEKIDQRGGGVERGALHQIVVGEFMREYRVVDARVTEQLQSGTVILVGDCLMLTNRGRRIASLSRFVRAELLPTRRQLLGEYTDILTDPLRNSRTDVTYRCGGASATAGRGVAR